MKKREKKLEFHRDTLRSLEPAEVDGDLRQVAAAGPQTSEGRACCGGEVVIFKPGR